MSSVIKPYSVFINIYPPQIPIYCSVDTLIIPPLFKIVNENLTKPHNSAIIISRKKKEGYL